MNKEQMAETWGRSAPTYDRVGPKFFAHFGKRLVEQAPIPPGARVLDVAAGRGAVLFPAAEKVGPEGYVTGIDFSEEMVNGTGEDIRARSVANARTLQMDAEHLQFEDRSFDCLLCGFAIFFFPNLYDTLAGFRRVLKPSGLAAFSTWVGADERWEWLRDLQKTWRPVYEPDGPRFDTADGMKTILSRAGFVNITFAEEEKEFWYADEDEWLATMWSHGGRFDLERFEPEAFAEQMAVAYEKLSALREPRGIPQRYKALYSFAHEPGG